MLAATAVLPLPRKGSRTTSPVVGVKLDAPVRKLDRERGGMPDLGRRLRREIPHALGVFQELFAGYRGGSSLDLGPAEGFLTEDQNVLVYVPQRGVGRR